ASPALIDHRSAAVPPSGTPLPTLGEGPRARAPSVPANYDHASLRPAPVASGGTAPDGAGGGPRRSACWASQSRWGSAPERGWHPASGPGTPRAQSSLAPEGP